MRRFRDHIWSGKTVLFVGPREYCYDHLSQSGRLYRSVSMFYLGRQFISTYEQAQRSRLLRSQLWSPQTVPQLYGMNLVRLVLSRLEDFPEDQDVIQSEILLYLYLLHTFSTPYRSLLHSSHRTNSPQ
ncbi:hypothetical protein VTN00DRAFT_5381 [Thermoascus crustaceus]|uniref:uncharacterized protein n=1 Tax=Thermoascus crustaceus TaxID=5088 RepID=UPI0037438317